MRERLDLQGRSYVSLTDRASATTAVIFVHGFWGCPEKTWIQFQSLMDKSHQTLPWWGAYDAYFYAYDSERQIGPNTASLLNFICSVYPSPKWGDLGADSE